MKLSARILLYLAVILAVAVLGFVGPVVAQDLSDNETCMECHADAERGAPDNPDRPQVHTPDGGFAAEAHEMWSCTDCHDMVTEIPHPEGMDGQAVDCLNCHEEVPAKQ